MAIVYVLKSSKVNKFYIGASRFEDPNKRLNNHNSGKVRSTKSGRPWHIVHIEHLESYTDARRRENFLKTGVGRKWIYEQFRNKD
jgi:putative endonuclease